jgi:hypothetical protein
MAGLKHYSFSRRTIAQIDFVAILIYIGMEIYFWYLLLTNPSFWIGVVAVGCAISIVVSMRIVWRERNYLRFN